MKSHCGWRSGSFLLLLLTISFLGVSSAFADDIIDNGKTGTSFTGTWAASAAAGSYGTASVWARDGAKYTWTFTPATSGSYDVSMWWTEYSSRATNIPVTIAHAGGTATVRINQQDNGGQWNVLGRYTFTAGQSYKVTITSQANPTSTCADAVKFSAVGGGTNAPPVAGNDTATTTEGAPVSIGVLGNDSDDGGVDIATIRIASSPGNGSALSNSNGTITYTPGVDFTGTDTFTYTVKDSQGLESNAATVTVTVNAVSAEYIIDNGKTGTSSTGTWAASGATGSYGTTSVWARDGAKYTWSFTPASTGRYEIAMWWTTLSSRSTSIPVTITHAGGTAAVTINQKENASKWNVLGRYNLTAGQSYKVTITSQANPTSTSADAVKFTFLSGVENGPPTAVNDSATATMNGAVTIDVLSNDTDDGEIDASSVSVASSPGHGTALPNVFGTVTYTPFASYTGTDSFTYTVKDSQGMTSNAATVTVTVSAVSAETIIDNGKTGTSSTGTWAASGATGSYGTTSVWARDGAKYSWTFTPAATGIYSVAMWWTVYSSRSTSIPVAITHSGGTTTVTINQKAGGAQWNSLGLYPMNGGVQYKVTVTSQANPTTTCADAVKFSSAADAVEYVAIGDSITKGSGDDISSDGTGYEPILESLLTDSMIRPVAVTNRGVSGVKASYGAQQISAILSDHPVAQFFLIQYGTNDSAAGDPVPSGLGLHPGDTGYASSYKGYMQTIVSSVNAAGRTPFLAKVPYLTGSAHSIARVQEYNLVIDELVLENGISAAPPDFYTWFHDHPDQLADELHPNGSGYQSMADLWFDALK